MTDLHAEVHGWIDQTADHVTEMKKRTNQQNRALHKYCDLVAQAMDDAGYDAQTAITMPIQLTGAIVKESIFKVFMKALFPEKTSTTELSTTEMQTVYNNMARGIALKFEGIDVPWPDRHGEMLNDHGENNGQS